MDNLIKSDQNIKKIKNPGTELLLKVSRSEILSLFTNGQGISLIDAISGLTQNSVKQSINKPLPSVGGVSIEGFDPNNVQYAVLLNNSEAVGGSSGLDGSVQHGGAGHVAVLLIDSQGRGMFYSYGPAVNGIWEQGQTALKVLTANEVTKFLDTGNITNLKANDGNITKSIARQHYNRFIKYKAEGNPNFNGYMMVETANKVLMNPGDYIGVGHSCENVAVDILNSGESGGLKIPYVATPNASFDLAYLQGGYMEACKIDHRQRFDDSAHILSWK